jgi:hypothetical protein
VLVSVVENGWLATSVEPPVKALKRLDLPELGRPTSPMRSTPKGYCPFGPRPAYA